MTELLVVVLCWLVLTFGLTDWLFTDARARGEDAPSTWALAAGGFQFLTGLGGFLVLAVYLWQRN